MSEHHCPSCSPEPQREQEKSTRSCPSCRYPAKLVKQLTVASLLKPLERMRINPELNYFLCQNPECRIVYFAEGGIEFSKEAVSVRIGLKETVHPIPLCYCFGWNKEELASELVQNNGRSPTTEKIRHQLKRGNCYCEITNPEGTCCLGNIAKATRDIIEELRQKKIIK